MTQAAQRVQMPVEMTEPATVYDSALVTALLEDAGMTLLALPGGRGLSKLSGGGLTVVRSAAEAYGYTDISIRPSVPSAARITQMDTCLTWLGHIPLERSESGSADRWSTHGGAVLRSIVGARMLVSPVTERHLFSWRRLGTVIKADYKSVQSWHARGIDIIVGALNRLSHDF